MAVFVFGFVVRLQDSAGDVWRYTILAVLFGLGMRLQTAGLSSGIYCLAVLFGLGMRHGFSCFRDHSALGSAEFDDESLSLEVGF